LLVSTLCTSTLFAKADKKLVDEYLKVSGAGEIILSLPQQIQRGYLQSTNKKVDIKSNFNSKKAIKYVKSKLSEDFSNGLLKSTIRYYKTPLGKKFKKSSIKAMSQTNIEKRAKFFKKIEKNPPSYDRLNIMNAFVDRLELTPVAVHLIGEVLGVINAQLSTTKDTNKILSSISYQIKNQMLENSLYAFRNFSDKELKRIMEYYYTNAGRFEQLIVSNIFKQLITESFSQIMEQNQVKMASKN
jgi:hypothetical protein